MGPGSPLVDEATIQLYSTAGEDRVGRGLGMYVRLSSGFYSVYYIDLEANQSWKIRENFLQFFSEFAHRYEYMYLTRCIFSSTG